MKNLRAATRQVLQTVEQTTGKSNLEQPEDIGFYASALANTAAMC